MGGRDENEMEMKPRLELNKNGTQCLICFYDPSKKDWDIQMDRAIRLHGLEDQRLPIIALPERSKLN